MEEKALNEKLSGETVDVTLPVRPEVQGRIHPVSKIYEEVTAIFGQMGFEVANGPDIEDQFHNFNALNMPADHPARQMQDTFYINDNPQKPFDMDTAYVVRTHTSGMQIRTMEKQQPPIRIVAPGRTYRSDYDATHTPMFHQIEGLVIDKNITMAHLKGCLYDFMKAFFELDELPVRYRPSYFPFTEPSAEMDIGCLKTKTELKVGAGTDWLEVLGCGMVHPNVLRAGGIDPNEYQGFAFGLGIDRLAMMMTNSNSIQDVLFFPQMKPEVQSTVSSDEDFVTKGIPQIWIDLMHKAGIGNIDNLKSANINKLFNDLNGLRKKHKLDIAALKLDELKAWVES